MVYEYVLSVCVCVRVCAYAHAQCSPEALEVPRRVLLVSFNSDECSNELNNRDYANMKVGLIDDA